MEKRSYEAAVHVHVHSPSRQDAQPPAPWRHNVEGADRHTQMKRPCRKDGLHTPSMMEHVRVSVDVGRADDSGTSCVGTCPPRPRGSSTRSRASAPGCGQPATKRSLSHWAQGTGHRSCLGSCLSCAPLCSYKDHVTVYKYNNFNFDTGLKLSSKKHFYGRAAAVEKPLSGRRGFSKLSKRTFTDLQ